MRGPLKIFQIFQIGFQRVLCLESSIGRHLISLSNIEMLVFSLLLKIEKRALNGEGKRAFSGRPDSLTCSCGIIMTHLITILLHKFVAHKIG